MDNKKRVVRKKKIKKKLVPDARFELAAIGVAHH
jgi:hypothetical protein